MDTELFILITDIIGTVAFAVSGAMAGIRKKMDIFGVNILALLTATGGGIIRDIVMGEIPPTAFRNPFFVIIAAVAANITFIFVFWKHKSKKAFSDKTLAVYDKLFFWFDTVGLAAFTADGVHTGLLSAHSGNASLVIINYSAFQNCGVFAAPSFTFLKGGSLGDAMNGTYLLTLFTAYVPVAFVVFAEHLADHENLSTIIGENLLENPGLTRTLLGDGIGSMVGAFFGACPNTTYGESIACVAITRNASTVSIWGAAVLCIIVSFISPLMAFLQTIPSCVMGGVCIALYGFIAVSGFKMLQKVNLNENRNLFVACVIFITGVGGMTVTFGAVEIRTVACALILGILTNVMLSGKKEGENDQAPLQK